MFSGFNSSCTFTLHLGKPVQLKRPKDSTWPKDATNEH